MKKTAFSLLFIAVCSLLSQATEIRGKVTAKFDNLVSVIDSKGHAVDVTVEKNGKEFSADVVTEAPDIVTLLVTYTNAGGVKSQLYTPVYVDPALESVEVDIYERDGAVAFKSKDPDAKALIGFGEFIFKNHAGAFGGSDSGALIKSLDTTAKSLALTAAHPLAADYLRIWSASSILSNSRVINRGNRRDGKPDFKNPLEGILSLEEVAANDATKYFPEFINAIIASTGKDGSLADRVGKLRSLVTNPELLKITERTVINRFITANMKKADRSGTLAAIDSVVADRQEYAMWVERVNKVQQTMETLEYAPKDVLHDAEGNEIRLSDFKGKYLYIDFWASWCVHCVKEIPALKQLEKEFGDSDITFVSISLDEDRDNWKKAMEKHDLKTNQFIVVSPEFAQNLQLSSIPRYMLYDKDSRLIDGNAPRPSDHEKISRLFRSLKSH